MGAIYRRELGAYFTSSIAYIFLAAFWMLSGWFFFAGSLSQGTTDMSYMFQSMFSILVFLIPILTMRLFSEEKKQKTEQGLLTAPVSLGELYTIGILMPFVYGLILSAFGQVEWGILFANFLALFLLGTAFIAVGTLISALTENQVAAAVLGIAALLVIQMIDSLVSYINITWLADAVKSLSFWTRYYAVTCGLFNVSTVIFYLSAAFIFNYLTIRVFERRRWS